VTHTRTDSPTVAQIHAAGVPVTLRALGDDRLLDVDFADPVRPNVVTAVIDASADTAPVAASWALTTRVVALLHLWHDAVPGDPELWVQCRQCEAEMGIVLPIGDVIATGSGTIPDSVVVESASGSFKLRLPKGADLAEWAATGSPPSLSDLGAPVDADVTAADAALASADPLVDFELEAGCPECGAAVSAPVDLEDVALRGLERAQGDLVRSVHTLAAAYSWDEATVLSLPPVRRRRYLELVEGR